MVRSSHDSVFAAQALTLSLLVLTLCNQSCLGKFLDKGINDPILGWPQWYRDYNRLPLRLCTSTAASANGPLCLGFANDPTAFPGNVGDEVFYFNANMNLGDKNFQNSDIDLRYIAALEAAYASDSPQKGQEIIFSRLRFTMHTSPNPKCIGDYTITHPYGQHTFNVPATGDRALTVTLDVGLGAVLDFQSVMELSGTVSPFLTVPNYLSDPNLKVGTEQFIGDPNVPSTFEGSPYDTNFLTVTGPTGCNVGGPGRTTATTNLAVIAGQVWTNPIPTPTFITGAEYSVVSGVTTIDVTATAAAGDTLALISDSSTSFPTSWMEPSSTPAEFHGHVEMTDVGVPGTIRVVNTKSVPAATATAVLVDAVQISDAVYSPASNTFCVIARTLAAADGKTLKLSNPSETTATFSTSACANLPGGVKAPTEATGTAAWECVCFSGTKLEDVPLSVEVRSTGGGGASANVVFINIRSAPITPPGLPVALDDVFTVNTIGTASLTLDGNDVLFGSAPPLFYILTQPDNGGTITPTRSTTAKFTYTPPPGASASDTAKFLYMIQQGTGATAIFSNAAEVFLNHREVAQPPNTVQDIFVVQQGKSAVFDVLANDSPSKGTAINPSTLKVLATPTYLGSAAVNSPNAGLITYTAGTTGTTDTFSYTVAATNGGGTSVATAVRISTPSAAETLRLTGQYKAGKPGKWILTVTSTVAGWSGTVNGINFNPVVMCHVATSATSNDWKPIGGFPYTGTSQTIFAGTAVVGLAGISGMTVPICANGIKPSSCFVQCATTYRVSAAFPTTAPGGSDIIGARVTVA